MSLVELLDARHFSCVSFCRGRDDVTWNQPGPKVGGGAAILFNNARRGGVQGPRWCRGRLRHPRSETVGQQATKGEEDMRRLNLHLTKEQV